MCQFIFADVVAPGWGCCGCKTYNGIQRTVCKIEGCKKDRCQLTIPEDLKTVRYYEHPFVNCKAEITAVTTDEKLMSISLKCLEDGPGASAGEEWTVATVFPVYGMSNMIWAIKVEPKKGVRP